MDWETLDGCSMPDGEYVRLDDLDGMERALARLYGGAAVEVQRGLRELALDLAKQHRDAAARRFLERARALNGGEDDAPRQAQLGLQFEEIHRFDFAAECYVLARATSRRDTGYWYFVHNNHAYCLAMLERLAEAEEMARLAIEIDPMRHNAHKNLGLALMGQGRLTEAAESFRRARDIRPSDRRAAQYLAALEARRGQRPPTSLRGESGQ